MISIRRLVVVGALSVVALAVGKNAAAGPELLDISSLDAPTLESPAIAHRATRVRQMPRRHRIEPRPAIEGVLTAQPIGCMARTFPEGFTSFASLLEDL